MKADKLIDAIETYSNVIVAFIVVQSVGFSFTYGTTPNFMCTVHTANHLASGLILHFTLSTILACGAISVMRTNIGRLSTENASTVDKLYRAKLVVVVLFALIPVTLLFAYSIGYEGTMQSCLSSRAVG